MVVQPPVHFFGLQGRVEPLQQAQLLRRPILDPHVAELILDECREPPRNERRPIVGHQKRSLHEWPVNPLRFLPRQLQGVGRLGRAVARREMAGEQVPRVVIDHGHRVPPTVARNVNVRYVHLPQVVGALGQKLEQFGRLVDLGPPRLALLE